MVVIRNQHKFNKAWEKLSEEKRKNSRRIIRRIAWKQKLTPNIAYHKNHNYSLQSEARQNKVHQECVKNMFIKRNLNSTYYKLYGKTHGPWPNQTIKPYYKKIEKF